MIEEIKSAMERNFFLRKTHYPTNYPITLRIKDGLKSFLGLFPIGQVILRNDSLRKRYYKVEKVNSRIIERPFIFERLSCSPGGKVLDFGCRESKLPIELANLGYNVVGVDLKNYDLTHPNFTFLKGNLLDLDIDPNFDSIIALSSLEHVGLSAYGSDEFKSGDKRALEKIRENLKPGGQLLLTLPIGKESVTEFQRVYNLNQIDSLLEKFEINQQRIYHRTKRKYWKRISEEDFQNLRSSDKRWENNVILLDLKNSK